MSGERLTTQLEMITSTVPFGRGIASISPFRNSTLVTPASAALARASASISSVMSRPMARPAGPTRRAERSTSIPPPEPRSSTVCPSRSSTSAVGLPQPSEAATAPAGSAASCAPLYSTLPKVSDPAPAVPSPQHPPSPQPQPAPDCARRAASAYRSRTRSLIVVSFIGLLLHRGRILGDTSLSHPGSWEPGRPAGEPPPGGPANGRASRSRSRGGRRVARLQRPYAAPPAQQHPFASVGSPQSLPTVWVGWTTAPT